MLRKTARGLFLLKTGAIAAVRAIVSHWTVNLQGEMGQGKMTIALPVIGQIVSRRLSALPVYSTPGASVASRRSGGSGSYANGLLLK